MLDVHPPHKPMHGVSEFLLHLFTITIGLLIALGLEGLVEWQHHRHLVHEAEDALHGEIASNAAGMAETIATLHKQQETLKQDQIVLTYLVKHGHPPENSSLSVDFRIKTFDDVSWRTAQATGATAYMPYGEAEEYANIYGTQAMLTAAESQAARDAIGGLSMVIEAMDGSAGKDGDKAFDPTGGRSAEMKGKIALLQGQLLLVDSLMTGLDQSYGKYLKEHAK